MVQRTIGAALAALMFAGFACGGDALAEVEFAEICGEVGPVRVLELAPGESMGRLPFKLGERVVHSVAAPPTSTGERRMAAWTTGPCGEAPRRVADDIDRVFTSERWPDLLLGCDAAAGQLLVLDPEGEAPPHVLFTGLDRCSFHWSSAGMVSFEEAEDEEGDGQTQPQLARLLLHAYPADPSRETVAAAPLLERMRIRSRAGQVTGLLPQFFDEYALALTEEHTLVRVGLADGAVATVQTGVAAFMTDETGRYVLWQDATPTNTTGNLAGKVLLRDRDDGSDVFLGESSLAGINQGAFRYFQHGVLYLNFSRVRVFSLPDLGFVELPPLGGVVARLDEDRWLMQSGERVSLVELASGATTTLYRGVGEVVRVRSDGFELLQVPPCCQTFASVDDEGPLWFVSYSGEVRRLADRMTRFSFVLPDGRRVALFDLDGPGGALMLTDPETRELLRIDDGVYGLGSTAPQVYGDDVLVYTIADEQRAGLWIARLPPAR